jgi:hypothetical protein
LRANLMTPLPEPLHSLSSSENPNRRDGTVKVPRPAWTFEESSRYPTSSGCAVHRSY